MANPWGSKVGNWAAEVEADEEKEMERMQLKTKGFPSLAKDADESFPALGASAPVKKEKKKEKKVTLTLQEFAALGSRPISSSALLSSGDKLTVQEQIMLPKGPRERDESEDTSSLGGGFRRYGGQSYGSRDGRDREGGFGRDREGGFGRDREGGFGRDREGGFGRDRDRDRVEFDGPSRADESSNWATSKPPPSFDRDRYSGRDRFDGAPERRSSDRDGPSKADEVSHWGSTKQYVPSGGGGGGGGGFGSERGPRRGFEDARDRRPDPSSRADDVDTWKSSRPVAPSASRSYDSPRESSWGRRDAPREFVESTNTSERPKLNLQKRTLPLENNPPPAPAPSPASVSPPPGQKPSEAPAEPAPSAPRPKPNPFGGARPREEVLAEKGVIQKSPSSDSKSSADSASSNQESSGLQTPEPPATSSAPNSKPSSAPETQGAYGQKNWRLIAKGLESRPSERPQSEEERKLAAEIDQLSSLLESAGLKKKGEELFPPNGNLKGDEDQGGDREKELLESKQAIESMNAKLDKLKKDLDSLKKELDEKYKTQSSTEVERWERNESGGGGEPRTKQNSVPSEPYPERGSRW